EDGRIIVVKTGTFTLRTADTFDTGLYHCVGTNYNDADILTFRITVVDPHVEPGNVNGAQLSAPIGSTLVLPCTSTGVPDAAVSWVLPGHTVLHHSLRNKQVFDNGTLRIQGVTERDSGYFTCVAANRYGVDLLVSQVLIRKDRAALQQKRVAGGEREEGDGSGQAMLASAVTQPPPPAAWTANREPGASASRTRVAQKRNGHGTVTYRPYRDRTRRRFRGHRRQLGSSARRVDPQRWAAFLEKTKRNSASAEKRGEAATKPPSQARAFSAVPGDEEEISGDLPSPEEELLIPVTVTAAVSGRGRVRERVRAAGHGAAAGNTPAGKTSVPLAQAVTPLPSPPPQSVSPGSRRSQSHLTPTPANSGEGSDLSRVSAEGVKPSATADGAGRASTHPPAWHGLGYTGEGNLQHLQSGSTTPGTDGTDTSKSVDQIHVVTESLEKVSTNTDRQMSAVTAGEQRPEFGQDDYFHSARERVTPEPPLATATAAHQQAQGVRDVTARTPQALLQYGRRRKIPGRRRIVRPGRVPGMKEHRYNFGRPGSARGGTAVDIRLNVEYVPNLPTFNNLSSSINLFIPEAPLSPPSTMNVPLEYPVGAHPNTAFLGEEENEPGVRQKAATTVVPFIVTGIQHTAQGKAESSAPSRTNTDGVQPSSIRPPPTALGMAHGAAAPTHTVSTEGSPTPESVSPSTKPQTSPKSSQRGKMTQEPLFSSGAQKEVLKGVPNQQPGVSPATEVSTVLPKATAALSTSKMSPLHLMPVSTGVNQSRGFWSLNKPTRYGKNESEEHLPTAALRPASDPAASVTTESGGTGLQPTATPITAPQTNTKPTKSKTFRVGRRRGQRRRRPPKPSPSPAVTAGLSTAVRPPTHTAMPVVTAAPVVMTVGTLTVPARPTPANPPSTGTVLVTAVPALGTPEAPRHVSPAAIQPSAAPLPQQSSQPPTGPPDSRLVQTPTTPAHTTPGVSKPLGATKPSPVCATPGAEAAQHVGATATGGEKPHPDGEESIPQETQAAQPTFPAGSQPSAPAAAGDVTLPGTQHPTPPS
ncbi:IGS10 protein, partial [Pterocles burchelli]|nr:IGS10 protein [Pterocles burchelli]